MLGCLALSGCGGGGGGSGEAAPAPMAFVSEPDCPGPAQIVREEDPSPLGITFLRVQNMGDPGTPEFEREIANAVTWPVGEYTGYFPADPQAQRGFRDEGPPALANAYQLGCDGAGFLINTSQFSHAVPLLGEGPNISIARDFPSGRVLWRDASSVFTIEADLDLRHTAYQAPHFADGTAQLGFFYYAFEPSSGIAIAHVIGLFDSRPPNHGNSMVETLSNDFYNHFAFSPLAPIDGSGAAVQFVRPGANSALARTGEAWKQRLHFRAEITHAHFAAMLARLRAGPLPNVSPRPEDWRLGIFGVLAEVFPGTGNDHNVTMGASLFNLRASGG